MAQNQISKTNQIESALIENVESPIEAMGYQLWDVCWIPNQHVLRVYISKENWEDPVTHVDCGRITHAIETVVEENPKVRESYHLEVSSLGAKPSIRTLGQLGHFLHQPLEFTDCHGKKFTAVISSIEDDGAIKWQEGSETSTNSKQHGISDFKRIHVKKARF